MPKPGRCVKLGGSAYETSLNCADAAYYHLRKWWDGVSDNGKAGRFMMRSLTSRVCAAVVALSLAAAGAESGAVFGLVRRSVAVIGAGGGSGSGFVLQMDGRKYLVTNDHVLRGGRPFTAVLLDGRALTFDSLEVAENRDLVRMGIVEKGVVGLEPAAADFKIGEHLTVFGNSDGKSVVTSLPGRIVGVGPDMIETDAAFVPGNSGSPMVNDAGQVCGVATLLTLDRKPKDWTRWGTRFEEVRRYGLRIDGAQWKAIKPEPYFERVEVLTDIRTYCQDFYMLCYTDTFVDKAAQRLAYSYEGNKARYKRCLGLCKVIAEHADKVNEYQSLMGDAVRNGRIANGGVREGRGFYSSASRQEKLDAERTASIRKMQIEQTVEKFKASNKRAYDELARLVNGAEWVSARMKKEATSYLDAMKGMTAPR